MGVFSVSAFMQNWIKRKGKKTWKWSFMILCGTHGSNAPVKFPLVISRISSIKGVRKLYKLIDLAQVSAQTNYSKAGNNEEFITLQRHAEELCLPFVTCVVILLVKPAAEHACRITVIIEIWFCLLPLSKWHLASCEQLHTGDDLRLIWPRGEDALPDISPPPTSPTSLARVVQAPDWVS